MCVARDIHFRLICLSFLQRQILNQSVSFLEIFLYELISNFKMVIVSVISNKGLKCIIYGEKKKLVKIMQIKVIRVQSFLVMSTCK